MKRKKVANPVRIAVLVSGGGTNLQALIDAQKARTLRAGEICLVISNKKGAYALTRANENEIPSMLIDRSTCASQDDFEVKLLAALAQHKIDMIILAGFLSILSDHFVKKYPRRIINVHPSLIPAFCGAGYYGIKVHEAALARGVKVTGATVHYVNEIPDGGEIILQKSVAIHKNDTAESLQQRVMKQAEWMLLPRAAELVALEIYAEKNPQLAKELLPESTPADEETYQFTE